MAKRKLPSSEVLSSCADCSTEPRKGKFSTRNAAPHPMASELNAQRITMGWDMAPKAMRVEKPTK